MNYSLPFLYTKDHLNRITQLTEHSVEKFYLEDVESDYSDDYDSDAPDKEFYAEYCEDYDPKTDLRSERPDNY